MFHWRDGWFFRRTEDGSVEVIKREDARPESPVVVQAVIPEAEWASIVASVSAGEDNYDRFMQVRRFHAGQEEWP